MISERLKLLRQELGLSQPEMALKAKVSQPMIVAIEKGNKLLSSKVAQRLIKEFNLSKDYFIIPIPFNEEETRSFMKHFASLPRSDQDLLYAMLEKMILLKRFER